MIPYQAASSPPMTPALRRACACAVHVITTEGRVLRAGRAALFVIEKLGWRAFARILSLPPLIWIVEFLYLIVASNRSLLARYFFRHE